MTSRPDPPRSLHSACHPRRGSAVVLAFAVALSAAPLKAQEAPPPPIVRTGAELFQTSGCLHCHTMNGEGGTKGPDLSAVGRRLKPEAIRTQIQQGKCAMPPFQDALTEDEITALVHYLEKARKKK